ARRDDRTASPRFVEQRVEHVARPIGIRKEFAAGFFVERHADLAEERDGVGDRERPENAADDRRRPAPEIAFGDRRIRDVAAAAAADQNLGAGRARAVEDDDRSRWIEAAREDRGREPGGAGADDRDVARWWPHVLA